MPRTTTETTVKILARLARGDTLKEISTDTGLAITTIHAMKKRNQNALETIKSKMIDHEVTHSKKILSKAHSLIESRLDKASRADQKREELIKQLKAGEIEWQEYKARESALYEPTLTELNAVAREAFNQSQIEDGKPSSISNSSHDTKQQLVDLVEALNKGDEVQLFKMIINPQESAEAEKHHGTIHEGELA